MATVDESVELNVYNMEMAGHFFLSKKLSPEHAAYLKEFWNASHDAIDEADAASIVDPLRKAVGLPIGPDGCYVVNRDGDIDLAFRDLRPASGCPNLWCPWLPTECGSAIVFDNESVDAGRHAVQWLNYLIRNFLAPWGYILEGRALYRGDDFTDVGEIICEANRVIKVEWYELARRAELMFDAFRTE